MARTVVFAERTLSGFAYNSTFGCYAAIAPTLLFTLTEGQEYVAVVDGVEYTLIAVSFMNGTSECVYIGNTLVQGGVNNGIPFATVCDMTNGYTYAMSHDTATSHTVALYIEDEDEPEPDPEPEPIPTTPHVSLYDRTGTPGNYEIGKGIRLFSADGTPRDFISSSPVEATIQPNFAEGDMEVLPNDDELFSKVTVRQPETLVPENIAKDVDVCGIIGTMVTGKKIVCDSGTLTGHSESDVVVEHSLGVTPDLIIIYTSDAYNGTGAYIKHYVGVSSAFTNAIGNAFSMSSTLVTFAAITSGYSTYRYSTYATAAATGNIDTKTIAFVSLVNNANENNFHLKNGGGGAYFQSKLTYNWIAIGGLI